MQDIRSITSGGGGGGGGGTRIYGGDRRLRPFPNQPLKCPRCDSLNTKFCYYNNYNLSQPRHFCKSCRRYWTKGGVLRNVPVGGGCRKTKRSKPKASVEFQKERKSVSYSSSESSSLTVATATATTNAAKEAPSSASASASAAAAALPNFPDSRLLVSQAPNPDFEPSVLENLEQPSNGVMFTDSGSLPVLMSVPNPALIGYNLSANHVAPFRLHHQEQQQQMEHSHQLQQEKMMIEELKMQELTVGCADQAVAIELPMQGFQKKTTSNGDLTVSEWQLGSGDHGGLFDLPGTVDHAYWSQSQWTDADHDQDHHLFLP